MSDLDLKEVVLFFYAGKTWQEIQKMTRFSEEKSKAVVEYIKDLADDSARD